MERSHFSRLFARQFGLPPAQYVQKRRVERACQLLLEGTEPLAAIADELGFVDAFHFSKVFKRALGVPPRDFRLRGGMLP